MTTAQQIFTVFLAIFWGSIANVLGRWRMFHSGLIFHGRVISRLMFSFVSLNVLPVLYFAWIFYLLRGTTQSIGKDAAWLDVLPQVILGVVPALAIFSFYRLWLVVVELRPHWFYYKRDELQGKAIDRDRPIEDLEIHTQEALGNLLVGILYFIIAVVGPLFLAP